MDARTPLAEAASITLEIRTGEVFAFAGGVLDTDDIERVHDMRVATRRLRAAMAAFRPCFPKTAYKATLGDVKLLASALGARRDPDVALAQIEAIATRLPAAAQPGVMAFADEVRIEQLNGNLELEQALSVVAETQLEQQLLALAAGGAVTDGETFGDFARDALAARKAKLRQLGDRALATGEADDLHAVRIAAKRLRYLYEISAPAIGAAARDGAKQARDLQDLLGDLHDCDVMSERLRSRAGALSLRDPRYVGYEALASFLDAKRRVLHRQYVEIWPELTL